MFTDASQGWRHHLPVPEEFSFIRYLESKRSVEERALNLRVWNRLAAWLRERPQGVLDVVEVGAGIGAMLIRLLDSGLLLDTVYEAVDRSAESQSYARDRIVRWARSRSFEVQEVSEFTLLLNSARSRVRVEFIQADIEEYLEANAEARGRDLLIAHAVLDLLDVPAILPQLLGCLKPQAGFYFPINFDGVTIFEPVLDLILDEEIFRCYHQTMDQRRLGGSEAGESRTGRRLFGHLALAGGKILAAGSSDWIVYPQNGAYPDDEAYFIKSILYTMETALSGHPDLIPEQLDSWLARRRAQVDAGELTFIAHQIDLFGLR